MSPKIFSVSCDRSFWLFRVFNLLGRLVTKLVAKLSDESEAEIASVLSQSLLHYDLITN